MQNLDRITLTQDADVRKIDSNFVKVKDAIDAAETNINNIIDDTIGAQDPKANKATYSIVKISNLLVNAMKYQGQVATYNDLPNNLTLDNAGWLYNVLDTGDNYAWNGTGWDNMHGEYVQGVGIIINGKTITIDASVIYNKTEVNTLLNNKQNTLTPGSNISIVNNVISATGGGNVDDVKVNNVSVVSNKVAQINLTGKQNKLTADASIDITNDVISAINISLNQASIDSSTGVITKGLKLSGYQNIYIAQDQGIAPTNLGIGETLETYESV